VYENISRSHSLSHTDIHSLSLSRARFLSLARALSLSFSLSPTHTHTLALSLSHALSLCLSRVLSLSRTLCLSRALSLSGRRRVVYPAHPLAWEPRSTSASFYNANSACMVHTQHIVNTELFKPHLI
jgi:hypothetical protein